MLEGGEPSFSFEIRSPLQVPIIPLRVRAKELRRVRDVVGVEMLVVVRQDLCERFKDVDNSVLL